MRTIINAMKKLVAIVLVASLAFIGALALIPTADVETSSHVMKVSIDGQDEREIGWTEVDSISADWKYTALDAIKDCVDACTR